MLTADDERGEGRKTDYLQRPSEWRAYDPALLDQMRNSVLTRQARDVRIVQDSGIIPRSSFFSQILHDGRIGRQEFSDEALGSFAGKADLIFYDPENGLEVPSRPIVGRVHASMLPGTSSEPHILQGSPCSSFSLSPMRREDFPCLQAFTRV